jgi:hypothetical protein
VIATAAGAVVTFIYSVLLVKLNRSGLPGAIKIRGFRLVGLGLAILFYGFFSILLLIDQAGKVFGGG